MKVEHLTDKLVSWVKEKVLVTGCRGVVLGMSGGIDSSVLAVICHRTLPESTLGIIMPCYSSGDDMEHARAVADKFSISTEIVVLDTVFDTLLKVLPEGKAEAAVDRMAKSNLKVRLRMLTLYYFANQLKYIVAGSSNKSELSVGYFTKYGDGGADILPLGNLVKRQVRELARFLGIPQQIIDKPPSAGLWEGQTDEADLGFSYKELDNYLVTGEAGDELRERIGSMIVANRHKRLPPIIAELENPYL